MWLALQTEITREWMALPSEQRAKEEQVSFFLAQTINRHHLRPAFIWHGRIREWLLPYVGKP